MNKNRGKILDEILRLLRSKSNYRFTVQQVANSLSIPVQRAYQLLNQLVQKSKIQPMGTIPSESEKSEDLSFQINEEGFFFIKKGGFERVIKRRKRKLAL